MTLLCISQSLNLLTAVVSTVINKRHGSPLRCSASGDQMGMWTGTTQKGPETTTAPATVCGECPSKTPLVEAPGRQTERNNPQVRKPALQDLNKAVGSDGIGDYNDNNDTNNNTRKFKHTGHCIHGLYRPWYHYLRRPRSSVHGTA
jgi:hypothetical protein